MMPKKRPSIARLLFCLAAAQLVCGCVGPQRAFEEAAYHWEAKHAYKHTTDSSCLTQEVTRHYERGWRHGYVAVAQGRDDCPPAVPPHPYLGKRYQDAEGQQLVTLWYRGYSDGVMAARQCGYGQRIVLNECDCRPACQAACLSPACGVLPDPSVHLSQQSYAGPAGATAGFPTVAPVAPAPALAPARGAVIPTEVSTLKASNTAELLGPGERSSGAGSVSGSLPRPTPPTPERAPADEAAPAEQPLHENYWQLIKPEPATASGGN